MRLIEILTQDDEVKPEERAQLRDVLLKLAQVAPGPFKKADISGADEVHGAVDRYMSQGDAGGFLNKHIQVTLYKSRLTRNWGTPEIEVKASKKPGLEAYNLLRKHYDAEVNWDRSTSHTVYFAVKL